MESNVKRIVLEKLLHDTNISFMGTFEIVAFDETDNLYQLKVTFPEHNTQILWGFPEGHWIVNTRFLNAHCAEYSVSIESGMENMNLSESEIRQICNGLDQRIKYMRIIFDETDDDDTRDAISQEIRSYLDTFHKMQAYLKVN